MQILKQLQNAKEKNVKHFPVLSCNIMVKEGIMKYHYTCINRKFNFICAAVIHRITEVQHLTLLHSERPKLHTILAFLSAIGLTV